MDIVPHQSAQLLRQARLLLSRLERLTPDSSWAHRASGCRGSLLRLVACLERDPKPGRETLAAILEELERAIERGFSILLEAARERYK